MRTNALSLSALASALLLAASAASISGCGRAEEKPQPVAAGHAVSVNVIYDEVSKTYKMENLGPEKKSVLKKDKDWMEWSSKLGKVNVTFTENSPFDAPPKHDEKKVLKSGPAKKKGTFPYEATLVLDSDGTEHKVDPIIEVMD